MSKVGITLNVDWQTELRNTAFKYHAIVAWVAVILNPIWGISDYYNIPNHFSDFLIFRVSISCVITICLLFKNKLFRFPEIIAYVPFLGISIQNAYMHSFMDVAEFQRHTFAYIALFIGAGMFVIWRPINSFIVVLISFVANYIFLSANSKLSLNELLVNGLLLTGSVALFTIILINARTNLTKKEIIARLLLADTNKKLEEKNEIIEEQNTNTRDSINYAKHIQNAILPPISRIEHKFRDFFILFKPKDIVSGDFFWYSNIHTTPIDGKQEEIALIAAVDCTGHGVPGALMSIIGSTLLNQSASERTVNSPSEALIYLNTKLSENLGSIQDGMDISLCAFNFETLEMQFAGANNPIYIIRDQTLIELKADKMPIGGDHENAKRKVFTNNSFQLLKNDTIYLFTDGYADQFGGDSGKKFKYKNLKQLLLSMQDSAMEEQKYLLEFNHNQWRGNLEQVDDILIIGIRI